MRLTYDYKNMDRCEECGTGAKTACRTMDDEVSPTACIGRVLLPKPGSDPERKKRLAADRAERYRVRKAARAAQEST